ncbi:hypothetical protein GCM10025876_00350 [Demequina litorisediminis]|uniref:RNA-binding S4 domain-containing protein n=1 Tax=Demequina litorisediminis TaxID=1849022 RepID=A0ABQ6I8M7_9MICO|nr:hypothetical protein GCM10025876_00350 [Demequina litorisediminis]
MTRSSSLLEMRLDALVLRAGFGRTILQARQAVLHRHILVDGQIVDRPSFRVKPGQTIQVKPKAVTMEPYMAAAAGAHRDVLPEVPDYLDVTLEKPTAKPGPPSRACRGPRDLRGSGSSSSTTPAKRAQYQQDTLCRWVPVLPGPAALSYLGLDSRHRAYGRCFPHPGETARTPATED